MKLLFKIILFMIFFNISALMITAMNIFPAGTTLYGDAVYDAKDPNHIPSAEDMFSNLLTNMNNPIISGLGITYTAIMFAIVTFGIVVSFLTKDAKLVATGIIATVFVIMFANSKALFENMLKSTSNIVGYLALMIGVGVLIIFVITAMDYVTAQSNEE